MCIQLYFIYDFMFHEADVILLNISSTKVVIWINFFRDDNLGPKHNFHIIFFYESDIHTQHRTKLAYLTMPQIDRL